MHSKALVMGVAVVLLQTHLARPAVASFGTGVDGSTSDVVILRDAEGRPILPDLEAARSGRLRAPGPGGNELRFTFDSPTYPWTPDEVATMAQALSDLYPATKEVYGPPAFDITVNVRKDPTIDFAGLYYASLNEMVLQGSSGLDVLVHEMIHAFRDDASVSLPTFEEGMTRAAEVEVFARLATYMHPWDEHHSYHYDVYYQALSTPEIGTSGGWGYLRILRYQLTGYAWGKALLEDPAFLLDFNAALYPAVLADPGTSSDEARLVAMAAAATQTLEGRGFTEWYAAQGVLDTAPPVGWFLYQRINQFTIDFFRRSETGEELPQGNAMVNWAVHDHRGTLLDSGSGLTGALGWLNANPSLPPSYAGRVAVVASADTPDGPISSTALRAAVEGSGVFGIVEGADSGQLRITPIDAPASAVTVPVVDGAFYAPSLEPIAGRFEAAFTGDGGEEAALRFNKDAARYFAALSMTTTTTTTSTTTTTTTSTTTTTTTSTTIPAPLTKDTLRCLAKKRTAWGNFRDCQAAEDGKQLKLEPSDPAKCQMKLDNKLTKLTEDAARAGVACRYRPNGDGTVTDYDTGLQWEQKTEDGSVHDVGNVYSWWDGSTPPLYGPSGTAFTVLLGTLNACQSNDGSTVTHGGFAGHCDWRLPTIAELLTIVDITVEGCRSGNPCIDPLFGPTEAQRYWSGTSGAGWFYAFEVNFYYGVSIFNAKGSAFVRAVRSRL